MAAQKQRLRQPGVRPGRRLPARCAGRDAGAPCDAMRRSLAAWRCLAMAQRAITLASDRELRETAIAGALAVPWRLGKLARPPACCACAGDTPMPASYAVPSHDGYPGSWRRLPADNHGASVQRPHFRRAALLLTIRTVPLESRDVN